MLLKFPRRDQQALQVLYWAAFALFALDLVVVLLLLWPDLVPLRYRAPLRWADLTLTWLLALLVLLLVFGLRRAWREAEEVAPMSPSCSTTCPPSCLSGHPMAGCAPSTPASANPTPRWAD